MKQLGTWTPVCLNWWCDLQLTAHFKLQGLSLRHNSSRDEFYNSLRSKGKRYQVWKMSSCTNGHCPSDIKFPAFSFNEAYCIRITTNPSGVEVSSSVTAKGACVPAVCGQSFLSCPSEHWWEGGCIEHRIQFAWITSKIPLWWAVESLIDKTKCEWHKVKHSISESHITFYLLKYWSIYQ